MPRKPALKKIVSPPLFTGYKPYGCTEDCEGYVELLYEEFECIKLADYEMMTHQEACVLMGISRAGFARIYETARRKIARAFVEAKEIRTSYGNVYFDNEWYICNACNARFTRNRKSDTPACPNCRSKDIKHI